MSGRLKTRGWAVAIAVIAVLAMVVWWRDRPPAAARAGDVRADAPRAAVRGNDDGAAVAGTQARGREPIDDRSSANAPVTSDVAPTHAARAPGEKASRTRAILPVPAPASRAPAPETLVDRTGWGSDRMMRQLNKELMPLVSECVEMAQARKAGLHGSLIVQVVVAPADEGNAIVAGVTPRADSQVDDPELIECIRQSSFALEGLDAPRNFDLSIPIDADHR
jgi:hypothetical protein